MVLRWKLPSREIQRANLMGFTGGLLVKNPSVNAGDTGLMPGPEDFKCHGATKPITTTEPVL